MAPFITEGPTLAGRKLTTRMLGGRYLDQFQNGSQEGEHRLDPSTTRQVAKGEGIDKTENAPEPLHGFDLTSVTDPRMTTTPAPL